MSDYCMLRTQLIHRLDEIEPALHEAIWHHADMSDARQLEYDRLWVYATLSPVDPTMISIPKDPDADPHSYEDRHRVRIRPSKWLDRLTRAGLLPDTFDRQAFAVAWGKSKGTYTVDIVTGGELREWYDDTSYAESCMSGSDAVNLYVANPDKVGLLAIRDCDGRPAGRALIWRTDQDVTVVDRIHPSDDGLHCHYVRQWALSRGYVVRKGYGPYKEGFDCPAGTERPYYSVVLEDVKAYPYMDTFCYGSLDENTLTLYTERQTLATELRQTDGRNVFEQVICVSCDSSVHKSYYDVCDSCGILCPDCFGEDHTYIDGETWHTNDLHVCDRCTEYSIDATQTIYSASNEYYAEWCERCTDNHACYCEDTQNYHRDKDAIECDNCEKHYLDAAKAQECCSYDEADEDEE